MTESRPSMITLPDAGFIALVSVMAAVATALSLAFRFAESDVSSLWLTNGVVLSALLAAPLRLWLPVVVACCLSVAAFDLSDHGTLHPSAFINVFEALVGALMIRRFAGPIGSLMDLRRLFASYACVLTVAAPLGAALGTLVEVASVPEMDAFFFFRTRLFADGLGLVVVSPAVHAIQAKRLRLPDFEPVRVSRGETAAFWVVLGAAALPVLSASPDPARNLGDLHYALLPLLLWGAFRLEPWVGLNAVLWISGFAAWQTAGGAGPFVVDGQSAGGRVLAYQIPSLTTAICVQSLLVLSNERRHATRQIEDTSERFRNIVETTNEWVWELDTRLVCTYSSPHCYEMSGYRPEEIVGKHLYETIHEDDVPRFQHLLNDFVAVKAPIFNFAHRHRRKDGSVVHVETNAVPILQSDGTLLGYRGAHRDVTARVEAEANERARQASNARSDKLIALGTVVSGVAHEINNPNQSISSNLAVLRRAWSDVEPVVQSRGEHDRGWTVAGLPPGEAISEVNEVLEEIADGSDRIRTIVTELRDYVRGESTYSFQPLNPNLVIESSVRLSRAALGARGHRVELELDRDPPAVVGNALRLEQVLVNLIANASDALAGGRERGDIVVSSGPIEGEAFYPIRVVDEGHGIDPDCLDRVLDPFFSTKRETGGTGLGLAISSRIAREHGGRLEIESSAGAGTCATLWLRLAGE